MSDGESVTPRADWYSHLVPTKIQWQPLLLKVHSSESLGFSVLEASTLLRDYRRIKHDPMPDM